MSHPRISTRTVRTYGGANMNLEGILRHARRRPAATASDVELGEAVCGHRIDSGTGVATDEPLRLGRERLFHTAFCGDTGFGKTAAAQRFVYETTRLWGLRTVILDNDGHEWRKLVNAPGLKHRVAIHQLAPGGVCRLRWNPLRIGHGIQPAIQMRAFCDIFGMAARLDRRHRARLWTVLDRVYRASGVLVDHAKVQASGFWGRVRDGEQEALDRAGGTPLADLTAEERQRLAEHRSRAVGLDALAACIDARLDELPEQDAEGSQLEVLRQVLHAASAAHDQYTAGDDGIDINEIVPDGRGVAVLEGGPLLDACTRSFLLAWAAWHLCHHTMVRHRRHALIEPANLQIVFDDAAILGGSVPASRAVAPQLEALWRDGRKYGIWLHPITQSPAALPSGILAACGNLFCFQLTARRDQEVVLDHMGPPETAAAFRGMLASMPVASSVVKLGYAAAGSPGEPVRVRPALLDLPVPTDLDLETQAPPGAHNPARGAQ